MLDSRNKKKILKKTITTMYACLNINESYI